MAGRDDRVEDGLRRRVLNLDPLHRRGRCDLPHLGRELARVELNARRRDETRDDLALVLGTAVDDALVVGAVVVDDEQNADPAHAPYPVSLIRRLPLGSIARYITASPEYHQRVPFPQPRRAELEATRP